jgi:hypothetical protein
MSAINLRAHFDGTVIRLDEPFDLAPNAQLIVTVLPNSSENDRAEWADVAADGLARVYGNDEPEYSAADIVP